MLYHRRDSSSTHRENVTYGAGMGWMETEGCNQHYHNAPTGKHTFRKVQHTDLRAAINAHFLQDPKVPFTLSGKPGWVLQIQSP